uniref:CYTOSOL_AP domain-containing protein n=1 Tax=Mesocestoides corti TaxID=53468 RepID=A0A5K3EPN3_MESCO
MRTVVIALLVAIAALGNVKANTNDLNVSPKDVVAVEDIMDSNFDVVVYVGDSYMNLPEKYRSIGDAIANFMELSKDAGKSLAVIPFPERLNHPRLIFANVGDLSSDTASSNNIRDAAIKALQKCHSLGFKQVLMVVGPMQTALPSFDWAHGDYPKMTAALGALYTLYVPLQVRENQPEKAEKITTLGLYDFSPKLLKFVKAVGEGMGVVRDIGDSDPERTAPPKIAEYIEARKSAWGPAGITFKVDDVFENKDKYPMAYAVNRATETQPRHHGKIIQAIYTPANKDAINQTIILVGKGVALDTGGADIKTSGGMYGMHNDKLGAAFVAGFFHALSLLKPAGMKVIGYMPFIRNSIGKNAYLTDEIVTLVNGLRVRIGNTDAEGRNIMTDVLYHAKEDAKSAINPHIFTIATLTGAASRAYGPYTVTMDNGPAEDVHMAHEMMMSGDRIGDPTEVARVRYEDFEPNMPISEWEDVEQFNTNPGATTNRGFTFPAGYLQMVSGLDKHGRSSSLPLKYTHCDIAGSGGGVTDLATTAPLRMFSLHYLWPLTVE